MGGAKGVGGEAHITHLELFIIGEIKKGKVTGFHNWIRFYMQEKEGLVDYYSHIYDGPVSTECGPRGLEKPYWYPDFLPSLCTLNSHTCLSP